VETIGWLAAAVVGSVTYVLRKTLQVALDGALYQVWTTPPPLEPRIIMSSPLLEMQWALIRWWHYLSPVEWVTLVILGAAMGVLLRARCCETVSQVLRSGWLIPVCAFLLLWVDYHPAMLLDRRIALGGFVLLLVLVFALNLVWAGLLEKTIRFLDRRIPEWLA
jgi:hypothetical protein